MRYESKAQKLAAFNGVEVYGIETGKFKSNTINVFFHDRLDRSTVTANALIPAVLRRGCLGFESLRDISMRLEELYGATFDCGIAKKGERQIIQFYLEYLADEYAASDEKVFEDTFHLLFDIITRPVTENGVFREDYLEQEKENLRKLIESRVNDKAQYAIERCMEEMCREEPYGIYEYGAVEDLKSIDPGLLYRQYRDVLRRLPVSVYITGRPDEKKVERIIKLFSGLRREAVREVDIGRLDNNVAGVKNISEKMSVNQGKLTLGFRTGIPSNHKDYYSLVVYNGILGGGIHSKLFQNVREKASLAYYAFSRIEKFKGLMVIGCGIEPKNREKTVEIILRQMDDIKKGKISDYEFEATMKTAETGIKALKDSQLQMVDFFLSQAIVGTDDDFDSITARIKGVTKREVTEVASKIKLDTVYFLEPEGKPS